MKRPTVPTIMHGDLDVVRNHRKGVKDVKRLLLVALCMSMFGLVATTAQAAAGPPPGKLSAVPQSALPAKVRAAIQNHSKARVRTHWSVSDRNSINARSRALLKRLHAKRGPAKPWLSTGPKGKPLARASYHCVFDYCGYASYGNGWYGDFYHSGYSGGAPWYTVYFDYYGYYCYYTYNGYPIYLYAYYYRGAYYPRTTNYWNYC